MDGFLTIRSGNWSSVLSWISFRLAEEIYEQLPLTLSWSQVPKDAQVVDKDGVIHRDPANRQFGAGALLFYPDTSSAVYVSDGQKWLLGAPTRGGHQYNPTTSFSVVPHVPYRRGRGFNDGEEVLYNVSMGLLQNNWNHVANGTDAAFKGPLATHAKATIRYQFTQWPKPQEKQHNFQRNGGPISRGELAFVIAQDMKTHIMNMNDARTPLRIGNKEILLFELVLISVKQVAAGSVQAIIGVRGH